jgi:hypothetical protein
MPNVRPPARPVARFSSNLVAHDLPRLPADRRADAVAFTTRRITGLPAPMAAGVAIVAPIVDGLTRFGGPRAVRFVARTPLPLVGDYVRLVRSLATAYVWETWPATAADGASAGVEGAGAGVA